MWAGVGWGPFVIWKRLVRRVLWGLVEIRAFLRASGMVRWWLLALGHWLLARSMLGTGFTRWRNSPWHNAMSRSCNCDSPWRNAMSRSCNCDSGLGDCLSGRVQLDRLCPSWRPAGGHAMATLYFFYERSPQRRHREDHDPTHPLRLREGGGGANKRRPKHGSRSGSHGSSPSAPSLFGLWPARGMEGSDPHVR